MIKIACCQYQIEELSDWQKYAAKITTLVAKAKKENAQILLLPEYAGIEAVAKRFETDEQLYIALQSLIPKYLELHQKLAQAHQIYIQAGTIVEQIAANKFVNRAYFFSPNGSYQYQDKLQLTAYEKSLNLLQHGQEQKIFETAFGKIGIAICYDSEFPEIVRRLVQHGASIILVPSYTTSIAGFNRVFVSCRARAIENQCYVAVSYVINNVNLSGDEEHTHGQAAIFGPADKGFPENGIIAQGKMNKVSLVMADISLEKIEWIRKHGDVHNFEDAGRCKSQEHPFLTIQF